MSARPATCSPPLGRHHLRAINLAANECHPVFVARGGHYRRATKLAAVECHTVNDARWRQFGGQPWPSNWRA